MAQTRVPCPRCKGPDRPVTYEVLCTKCGGAGYINEYRLFDPKKGPSALQKFLQLLLVGAFILFCASYCSDIRQKMQHQGMTTPGSGMPAMQSGDRPRAAIDAAG